MTENMSERFSMRKSFGKCFWAALKMAVAFTVFIIVARIVVYRIFLWDLWYAPIVYFFLLLALFFPIIMLVLFLDHRELARSDNKKEVANDE